MPLNALPLRPHAKPGHLGCRFKICGAGQAHLEGFTPEAAGWREGASEGL